MKNTPDERTVIESNLLCPDKPFDPEGKLPWNLEDILKDLEINLILDGMARGDDEIRSQCRLVIMTMLQTEREIRHRQDTIKDALANRETTRKMRLILLAAVKKAREQWFWLSRSGRNPEFSLHESLSIMGVYLSALSELRELAIKEKDNFSSHGFSKLFSLFTDVFDERYSSILIETLARLQFPNGIRVSGLLGGRGELGGFTLLEPEMKRGVKIAMNRLKERRYTFVLPPRDEHGPTELASLRARAILPVARSIENAGERVLNFIRSIAAELAFLEGCINLAEDLEAVNAGVCFPEPKPGNDSYIEFKGLYDTALNLKIGGNAISNDLSGGNQKLVIITGANRGGKSTFIRSIGQAVLMMQAGMFVGASQFSSAIFSGVFTHFKREEDRTMVQGKFDEELERMDQIIGHISGRALMLFNESFAATNAREGAEIAGEIVNAMAESGVTTILVTHLNEFAELITLKAKSDNRFLIAERSEGGERTFRILPGTPEETSYGADLYERVFGEPLMD